jgi:hypothetical protein
MFLIFGLIFQMRYFERAGHKKTQFKAVTSNCILIVTVIFVIVLHNPH